MNTIIDWQVTKDLYVNTMKIDQSGFIRDLMKKESISDCNSVNISMKASNFINIPEANNVEKTKLKTYQRLVGKLRYLLCGIRSNIVFLVVQLNRRNTDPYIGHFQVAKRVVCYLKGMIYLRLIYGSSF